MRKPKKVSNQQEEIPEITSEGRSDLNFKVGESFHKWFKCEAVARRLSMKDFLIECFKCYLNVHGSELYPKNVRFE